MFRNILVAVDGSPQTAEVVRQAADLARAEGADLTVLTVCVVPWVGEADPRTLCRVFADQEAEARGIVDEALAVVPATVRTRTAVGWGQAARAILDQVAEGGHDLVVLGSRGRGTVRSAVLGSTGHAVLDHSPVPVLILRGDGAARQREEVPAAR